MCIDVIIAYYFPDPQLQAILSGFFLTCPQCNFISFNFFCKK